MVNKSDWLASRCPDDVNLTEPPLPALDKLFWSEVKNGNATARSVAICYALLIAEDRSLAASMGDRYQPRDWRPINDGVMAHRGGAQALERVKALAWKINDAAAKVNEVGS